MASTVADIVTTVQNLLNDTSGEIWINSKLLPLIKSAYRKVQRDLCTKGAPINKTRSAAITVAVSATSIATSSLSDMIVPYQVWEKDSGAADSTYVPVTKVDDLPFRDQTAQLHEWCVEGGVIKFVGSTNAKQVVVSYEQTLTDLTSAANLAIPNSEDAIAYFTAAAAARSMGDKTLADSYDSIAREYEDDLSRQFVRSEQFTPRRRPAYGVIR